jgi:hypothetical protein
MEIKSNINTRALFEPASAQAASAYKKNPAVSDSTAFGQVDSLEGQLSGEPTTRGAAVARAQELIAQSSWPTSEVLGKVAGVLANHISQTSA